MLEVDVVLEVDVDVDVVGAGTAGAASGRGVQAAARTTKVTKAATDRMAVTVVRPYRAREQPERLSP